MGRNPISVVRCSYEARISARWMLPKTFPYCPKIRIKRTEGSRTRVLLVKLGLLLKFSLRSLPADPAKPQPRFCRDKVHKDLLSPGCDEWPYPPAVLAGSI
jgi:hypothetical protein